MTVRRIIPWPDACLRTIAAEVEVVLVPSFESWTVANGDVRNAEPLAFLVQERFHLPVDGRRAFVQDRKVGLVIEQSSLPHDTHGW